jgi:hypothetical protein
MRFEATVTTGGYPHQVPIDAPSLTAAKEQAEAQYGKDKVTSVSPPNASANWQRDWSK